MKRDSDRDTFFEAGSFPLLVNVVLFTLVVSLPLIFVVVSWSEGSMNRMGRLPPLGQDQHAFEPFRGAVLPRGGKQQLGPGAAGKWAFWFCWGWVE